MIKVYVLSKRMFNEFLNYNNINESTIDDLNKYMFISINDRSESFWGMKFFENEHSNLLTLQFDDVEEDGKNSPTNKNGKTKAFSIEDGKKVIEFLDRNKECTKLFVHCAAGISRSGAIGQFTIDYLNGDKEHFITRNPHILPNGKVLRVLHNLVNKYE